MNRVLVIGTTVLATVLLTWFFLPASLEAG
jgi:hypothetical protein